jgi:hypothetical protein
LHKVAVRQDADLGNEQPGGLDGGPGTGQPLSQAAVIVGIDGGYVRNWHDKKHNFEVVVGKSMAVGHDDRYLVRSQDEQPGIVMRFTRACGGQMPIAPFTCAVRIENR